MAAKQRLNELVGSGRLNVAGLAIWKVHDRGQNRMPSVAHRMNT
jgi:hypothetical protein